MLKMLLAKKIRQFVLWLYRKLFRINDSPQRTALGFGLGVFLGVLPGAGPVAAVTLALIFKVNRAAALAGSLLTNTWLSVAAFLLSLKVGAFLTGSDWQVIKGQYSSLIKDFHFKELFNTAVLEIIFPLVVGYVVIGLAAGFLAYLLTLSYLSYQKKLSR